MLGRKNKALPVKSTVGAGMQVDGPISFRDGLHIDGSVQGSVLAQPGQPSLLVIGPSGQVQGAIRADHVVIGGSVTGPVHAGELLELQAQARVEGDVRYKALEMQQGAVIAGRLLPQMTPPSVKPGGAREPTTDFSTATTLPGQAIEPVLEPETEAEPASATKARRDTRLF